MSGHGHVTPNPDGTKARCGGPPLCPECAREALTERVEPAPTGLRLAQNCEDWDVPADTRLDEDGNRTTTRTVLVAGAQVPAARLRRIGWLDQRGQVWLRSSDWMAAGGPNGSITPLLIDAGERDGR
jgi:hypothetical protein